MPSEKARKVTRYPKDLIEAGELYCKIFDINWTTLSTMALRAYLGPFIIAVRTAKLLGRNVEELSENQPNS